MHSVTVFVLVSVGNINITGKPFLFTKEFTLLIKRQNVINCTIIKMSSYLFNRIKDNENFLKLKCINQKLVNSVLFFVFNTFFLFNYTFCKLLLLLVNERGKKKKIKHVILPFVVRRC